MTRERASLRLIVGVLVGSSVAFRLAFGSPYLPFDWMMLGAAFGLAADGGIELLRRLMNKESP
jgi:hypothetical protein